MLPLINRISPIKKLLRYLIRASPSLIRYDLHRLDIFKSGLLEIFFNYFSSRPFRARDEGRFKPRVYFPVGFGPRGRDTWVDRVGPGINA